MTTAEVPIRRLSPDEVSAAREELVALQRKAFRMEADLIEDDRIPQLAESAEELVAAELIWTVAATEQFRIVAAIAFTLDGATVDVDRLVVDPSWHRRGLGAQTCRLTR